MQNPFEEIKIKPEIDGAKLDDDVYQKIEKRDAIYEKYDLMVNEVLDMFVAAHR